MRDRSGFGRCARYLGGVHRLALAIALFALFLPTGTAMADESERAPADEAAVTAVAPVAAPAQTETTPEEDDPDEEEVGEDINPPPEDEEPAEEVPEDEVEEQPEPAPEPTPAAAPAPAAELPRSGTDERVLIAAASLLLLGLALRCIARPA